MAVQFMTEKEVAARYALKVDTIRKWRYAGDGPKFYRLEGAIRYRLDDLVAYERQRKSNNLEQGNNHGTSTK